MLQLVEQYLRLFAGRGQIEQGSPVEITIAEVAAILVCTHRNATLTLKKMQNRGWLHWRPGRGRGNRSVLTCLLAPADLVLSVAKERVQKGDIHASRELISKYRHEWDGLEESYSRWMSSQFGLRVGRAGGEGRRIDTLRLFVDRPFRILDPVRVLLRSQTHLVKHLFDTLVRFDPVSKTIVGQLAFFWESDEPGKEWTLYLRKGILFHHGKQLTAEDVCYSLRRLGEAQSRHRWLAQSIQSVRAVEEYVVAVTLKQSDRLFLHALSKEYASIVPRDYLEEMGEAFAAWPIGTGPFKVVRNDDSMLALEAFQPYFAGRPFLDRVELWCVPEWSDEAGADQVQLLGAMAKAGIAPQGDVSLWKDVSRREQCFQYVSLNGTKPGPLHELSFRAGLAAIIGGRELQEELEGMRQPAEGWGGMVPFLGPKNGETLLARSGYAGEKLLLYTYPEPDHKEDAEWIRERCARYGIAVELVYIDPEELAESALLQAADLVVDSANVDERLELSLLEFVYAESLSIQHHLDEQARSDVKRLAAQLLEAKTQASRERAMNSILAVMRGRHTFIPLYSNRIERRAHARLSGISMDAYGWIDFSRMFVRV